MWNTARLGGNATGLPGALPCLGLLPPTNLPDVARARHSRRALEGAVEHGIALLSALGLPRIVTPDFEPVDPAEIGAALDRAIAALDEADAPTEDLEDEGHDEPSLGWLSTAAGAVFLGSSSDLERDTSDWEHTLGAPECHPLAWTMSDPSFEPADGQGIRRHRRDGGQLSWGQGARQDGEGEAEPGYDLPEGDDERCASGDVDAEPSLGSLDHVDQTAWADDAEGSGSDREFDPLDDAMPWTIEQRADRAEGRRIGAELQIRAETIRRRGRPSLIGPGSNVRLIGAPVLNAINPNLSWRPV